MGEVGKLRSLFARWSADLRTDNPDDAQLLPLACGEGNVIDRPEKLLSSQEDRAQTFNTQQGLMLHGTTLTILRCDSNLTASDVRICDTETTEPRATPIVVPACL